MAYLFVAGARREKSNVQAQIRSRQETDVDQFNAMVLLFDDWTRGRYDRVSVADMLNYIRSMQGELSLFYRSFRVVAGRMGYQVPQ